MSTLFIGLIVGWKTINMTEVVMFLAGGLAQFIGRNGWSMVKHFILHDGGIHRLTCSTTSGLLLRIRRRGEYIRKV